MCPGCGSRGGGSDRCLAVASLGADWATGLDRRRSVGEHRAKVGIDMSGWDSAVWPDDFGPPEDMASRLPRDFFVFRGTDQKWGSVHVPERLVRQRPWPTLQGRLPNLDEAIAWFEHLAEISGIMLVRLAPRHGPSRALQPAGTSYLPGR